MIAELRHGPFLNSLTRRQSSTLDELKRLAVGYINMEELVATKIQGLAKTDKGKASVHDSQPKREEKGAWDPKAQKGGFTPLRVVRGRIFREAHKKNLVNLGPQKECPQGTDRTKDCEYHRVHDHTTEECQTLKYKIEKLIKAGHFETYVDRSGRKEPKRQNN